MKKLYSVPLTFLVLMLLGMSSQKATAQTTLVAGDIAFTGYLSTASATDEFSFVILKSITAGTIINFTDNGWLSTNTFHTGEQTITWTAQIAYPAGTEFKVSGAPAGTVITMTYAYLGGVFGGSVSGITPTSNMLSLGVNGDQILAYQGSAASPTFISAIHMNVYVLSNGDPITTNALVWDGTVNTNFSSTVPTGLTSGVNALWIGTEGVVNSERNNAKFNCIGPLTTAAQCMTAINNQANWSGEFVLTGTVPSYTLPSGCNFMNANPIPVKLTGFNAINKSNDVLVSWKAENEINFSHYDLERSTNGTDFTKITSLAVAINSIGNTYTFNDLNAFANNNDILYYRLKPVDKDGKFNYSPVLSVRAIKKGGVFGIDHLVNPITSNLQFNLNSLNAQSLHIRILSMDGKLLISKNSNVNGGMNAIRITETASLHAGIYLLEIIADNGQREKMKIIKQ